MKRVLCLIVAILVFFSVCRIANGKEYIGLNTAMVKFNTFEWEFTNTLKNWENFQVSLKSQEQNSWLFVHSLPSDYEFNFSFSNSDDYLLGWYDRYYYKTWDVNNDGFVSYDEVVQIYESQTGFLYRYFHPNGLTEGDTDWLSVIGNFFTVIGGFFVDTFNDILNVLHFLGWFLGFIE